MSNGDTTKPKDETKEEMRNESTSTTSTTLPRPQLAGSISSRLVSALQATPLSVHHLTSSPILEHTKDTREPSMSVDTDNIYRKEVASPQTSNAPSIDRDQQKNQSNPYFPLTPHDSSPESLKSTQTQQLHARLFDPLHRMAVASAASSAVGTPLLNATTPLQSTAVPTSTTGLEHLAQLAHSAQLARLTAAANQISAVAAAAHYNPLSHPHYNPFLAHRLATPPLVNPLMSLYSLNNTSAAIADSTSLYLRSREALTNQLAAQRAASSNHHQ